MESAFSGECQANQKYLAFAERAEAEGFKQIAAIFRAAAAAENVHAQNHLRAMKLVGTTQKNLEMAIAGEHEEFETLYPKFEKEAREENHKNAQWTFEYARQVEKVHHELFSKAMAAISKGIDLPEEEVRVCDVCGYTLLGETPQVCPVCGATKEHFQITGCQSYGGLHPLDGRYYT